MAAERLAGFAAVVLGWGPDMFWRATAAELATAVRFMGGGDAAPADAGLIERLRGELGDG